MSRIGRMPIAIPTGVKVDIGQDGVTVKGPKGELHRSFAPSMSIALKDNVLTVSRPSDMREHRCLHGLTRSLLANMVQGVSKGYEKNLEIVGVGFRVEKSGEKLVLRVGFSHQVEVVPPKGVSFAVEGVNKIKVLGIDKEAVGETAAKLRAVRPPDTYKGKGIRYLGEYVRTKPGKAIGKKQ